MFTGLSAFGIRPFAKAQEVVRDATPTSEAPQPCSARPKPPDTSQSVAASAELSQVTDELAKLLKVTRVVADASVNVSGKLEKDTGKRCCDDNALADPVDWHKLSGSGTISGTVTFAWPGTNIIMSGTAQQTFAGQVFRARIRVRGSIDGVSITPSGTVTASGEEIPSCNKGCVTLTGSLNLIITGQVGPHGSGTVQLDLASHHFNAGVDFGGTADLSGGGSASATYAKGGECSPEGFTNQHYNIGKITAALNLHIGVNILHFDFVPFTWTKSVDLYGGHSF